MNIDPQPPNRPGVTWSLHGVKKVFSSQGAAVWPKHDAAPMVSKASLDLEATDVRPEVLAKGRALLEDPDYPPMETVDKIATLLGSFLSQPASEEDS